MAELSYSELSLLNSFVYIEGSEQPTKKLKDIVEVLLKSDNLQAQAEMTPEEARQVLEAIQKAIERNPSFGEYRVFAEPNVDGGVADIVTFYNGEDAVVVFEGTEGQIEWEDNVLGGIDSDGTTAQDKALDYIEAVSKEFGNITVTGHSKGGNKAQYVTLNSDNVDRCVSFDGQGFSDEFINNPDNIAKIEANRHKITSISADGDPVNALLNCIAGEIIFINTSNVDRSILTDKNGEISFMYYHKPNVLTDENGYIREVGEQKGIPQLFNRVSKYFMQIDKEDRDALFKQAAEWIGLVFSGKTAQVIAEINDLDKKETALALSYIVDFIGREDLQYSEIIAMLKEAGINTEGLDKAYVKPLWDMIMDLAKSLSQEELLDVIQRVQKWAEANGLETWEEIGAYIAESPLRVLELYMALGPESRVINEAIKEVFSVENISALIAGIAKEYPFITGTTVFALLNPVTRNIVGTVAGLLVVVGTLYLAADYILKNWDKIIDVLHMADEYVKEKVAEFYAELCRKIEIGVNIWVSAVCKAAEKLITSVSKVIDKVIDATVKTVQDIWTMAETLAKQYFKMTRPFLYMIASNVYRYMQEPLTINMRKLSECVDNMNRLANRIVALDNRLDKLYNMLCWNNVEQGENVFVSIANLYNLFRADLCIDEGYNIRRKAYALTNVFDEYKGAERWIQDNVPKGF